MKARMSKYALKIEMFHSFECGFPIFPASFIKEVFIPPLYVFDSFFRHYLHIYMRVYFWALNSVQLVCVVSFGGNTMLF